MLGSLDGGVPTVGPNPDRLQAMRDIKQPTCKKETKRLLGLFRTFNAFSPECALVTTFLCRLTWKNLNGVKKRKTSFEPSRK